MTGPALLRPSLAVVLVAVAAACGDGVITADGTPPPTLASVRATAAGALGVDAGDLRAALAWNIYSDELLECLDAVEVDGPLDFASDNDALIAQQLQLCWSFSERGRVETASVAIEPSFPASFTIPVDALPDPSLLSGRAGARLGIADLLVYSDDNGSGVFEETARGANAFADRVQGTSLPVGEEDVDGAWVIYREGELAPIFKIFEALYGCPEPPLGFSTLLVQIAEDDDSVSCTVDDTPVPVALEASARVASLGCAADPQSHQMTRPQDDEGIPADAAGVCVAVDGYYDLYITLTPDSVCPSFRLYTLAGCADTTSLEACRASSWSLLGDEPAWWPCKYSAGELAFFFEEPAIVGDGIDTLFSISWFDGLGQIDVSALEVEIEQIDGPVRIGAAGLAHGDTDGNGVWNAGERVVVSEIDDTFNTSTAPGTYAVRLLVDGVALESREYFWQPRPLPEVPQIALTAVDAAAPITDGVDEVALLAYVGEGPAFAFDGLVVHGYVGGELPLSFQAGDGGLVLTTDANGDGAFGPGDTLLLLDGGDPFYSLTPDVIASFGAHLYLSLSAEIAFHTSAYVGAAEVDLQ
jgi:hypothetical protein